MDEREERGGCCEVLIQLRGRVIRRFDLRKAIAGGLGLLGGKKNHLRSAVRFFFAHLAIFSRSYE